MARTVVTALALVAVATAGLLGVWLRGARTRLEPVGDDIGLRAWAGEAARTTSAALAGGVVAGILVAGFGGRLLMRLVAVTSADSAQGRLTEADEVVGRVSGGGTAFLVAFVGLFSGIAGGLGVVLFRRFLPTRSWAAGLVVAGVIGGLLARPVDLLNPDSIDFEILGPRWFAAGLGVALVGGLGMLGAELIDTLTNRWPPPSSSPAGVAGMAPILLLGLLGPGLVVVLPLLVFRGLMRPGRFVPEPSTLMNALSRVVVLAGTVGWLWITIAVIQIML